MAWRYLAYRRLKTTVLVIAFAMIATIPAGLEILVRQGEHQLRARARATPLLVVAKGSAVQAVLQALYFSSEGLEPIPYGQAERIRQGGLARAVPLHIRFHSQGDPIIGTELDYFEHRGLRVSLGEQIARVGDCVIGSAVARRRGVGPGEYLLSSPANALDLAGSYPLRLRVTGVLAPSDSPDDRAIFVDVKTAWLIEGLAHGHDDLAKPDAASAVLRREDDRIIANEALVAYNEVTDENVESFHFHGDPSAFPINAVMVIPGSQKNRAILLGRYQTDETCQAVRPLGVVDELLGTVFAVKGFVIAALAVAGLAATALAALVFMLSAQLRRREIETIVRIGGGRGRVAAILAAEIVIVVVLGLLVAGGLIWATDRFAAETIRSLVL